MMPDSPNTPPEDQEGRPIFAETRASTLIPRTPPTSGSEPPVPMPEEITAQPDIVIAPEPEAVDATATAPAPTEVATPKPTTDPEAVTAPEPTIAPPEPVAPTAPPEPIAPTAPPEPIAPVAPDAPIAPVAPDNSALVLTFAPAPDAPFQSSVTVGLYCPSPDARVFYTLDGSAPDENSTAYTPEKILLTQSATLSARAFVGGQSGPVNSADYIVSKPLWQENEPADQTDRTDHKISENQMAPDGWRVGAASVRGKLHAHRALWREDAFALGSVENSAGSWNIIILSDGAGSAPLSRVGSNIACQSAMGDLAGTLGEIETLDDDINADLPRIKAALVSAGQAALRALRDEADKRSQPLAAFAATLLILVRRAHGQSQLCAALQVGDGAIALDCTSGLKLLGAADHGQHSSETRFLTTAGMEEDLTNRVKFSLPADLRATLVVSDGVSDDYFPEDKRLSEVFEAVKPLVNDAPDAGSALMQWLGYEKKGSSDDRTLVLSWPVAESDASASDIGTSASDIGTSASDIGTSASDIGTSASDIGTSETASASPAVSAHAPTETPNGA